MSCTLGRCGGHERTDFQHILHWEGVVVLKGLIFIMFTLGGCGGLEGINFGYFTLPRHTGLGKTDFEHFPLDEGVVS